MIPSEGARKIRQWFDSFTGGFLCDDEGINQKVREQIRHSLAVAENIRLIFKSLSEQDQIIPFFVLETAALLHDVGRFIQSGKGENHAEEGVRILKEKNVLEGFSEREKELICRAVYFHNKKGAHLQCGDAEVIVISELLRRADKMDILGNR